MPNATVRADARPMPSDRRKFLRSFVAVGAIAAVGAPAALASLPLPVVAPSAIPARKQEAEGLLDIGRRMPRLIKEFWQASADLKAARTQFDKIAPLPPKPRKRAKDQTKRTFDRPFIKIVRGTPAPLSKAPMEASASHAYESLWDAVARGDDREFTRREIYQISDRFQWKFFSAADDCGLADALRRFREAGHDLREVAGQAFEFKPETRLGIAAQAFALIGASEAQDSQVGSRFASSLALNLIELEERLAPGDVALLRAV